MNSLKGIRDDIEKSTLISEKVLGKIVELIGENTYQLLKNEHSDIITTAGELAICLHSLEYLEKENERLKQQIEKMKGLLSELYSEFGFSELVKIRNDLPIEVKEAIKEIKEK